MNRLVEVGPMVPSLRLLILALVFLGGGQGASAQVTPPEIPSGNTNITFGEVTPAGEIPSGYRINGEGQLVLIDQPPADTTAIEPPPWAPSHVAAIAKEVRDCYNDGGTTPEDIFACSGYWVTPQTLVLCSLGERCPVIEGTSHDAEGLIAALLRAEGLDIYSDMRIDINLLELPEAANIARCAAGSSDKASVACAVTTLAPKYESLIGCGEAQSASERASCLLAEAGIPNGDEMAECLRRFDPAAAECASFVPDAVKRLQMIDDCNAQTGSAKIECLMSMGGPGALDAYRCAEQASQGTIPTECLADTLSTEQRASLECATQNGDDAVAASLCVAQVLTQGSSEVAKVVACANHDDPARCMLQDDPTALAAYECARAAGSATQRALTCASGFADPTTRTAIQCLAEGNGDPGATALCAAASFLPPELQDIASCAATSSGYVAAAICLGGVNMNEEWRIAAECAAQSGGEPLTFGTCAAGQLTVRELTKCFSSNMTDCFGPSNTIVVALDNAYNDLVYGPSDSNDAVRFFRDIGDTARSIGIPLPGSADENAFCAIYPAACLVQQLPNVEVPTPEQIWGDGDFDPFS